MIRVLVFLLCISPVAAQSVLQIPYPEADPTGSWRKGIEQRQEIQRRQRQRQIEVEAERRIKAEEDAAKASREQKEPE